MQRLQKEAELEFAESLRLLHTDYLDNYQLHGLSGVDEVEKAFSAGGVMDLMIRLKTQGHVRKLGITCHSEDAAVRAMELYDFDTLMFPLNWHMMIGHGFGSRALKMAREQGIGVIAIKALIERAWQDGDEDIKAKFPKSWCKPVDPDNLALRLAALKYTLSLGADTLIPPGDFENFAFVVEHIDECLKHPLNKQDQAFLQAEYEKSEGFSVL